MKIIKALESAPRDVIITQLSLKSQLPIPVIKRVATTSSSSFNNLRF